MLREANPGAEITWVINPEFAPLLRGNPDVNHVHFFPRGEFRGLGAPQSLLPWVKKTRTIQPDLALDFQGLLRSALIAKISGAKEIYGMSGGREGSRFFYDRVARVNRRGHAVNRYSSSLNVLAPLLSSRFAGRFRREIRSRVSMTIRRSSFFILLHAAAANRSQTRLSRKFAMPSRPRAS